MMLGRAKMIPPAPTFIFFYACFLPRELQQSELASRIVLPQMLPPSNIIVSAIQRVLYLQAQFNKPVKTIFSHNYDGNAWIIQEQSVWSYNGYSSWQLLAVKKILKQLTYSTQEELRKCTLEREYLVRSNFAATSSCRLNGRVLIH